jgi:thiamine-phosphate pyrophosphorylase
MLEKPCGLIAVIPPTLQDAWADNFHGLIRRFRPAALILKDAHEERLARILKKAVPLELAVLVEDDANAALKARAHGVFLHPEEGAVAKVRMLLGSAAVIGACCGLSRHGAMESADQGADFVAFDVSDPSHWSAAASLSSWWDEVTGVPVALTLGTARPEKTALSQARPDFVLMEETEEPGESLSFAIESGLQSQV